MHFNSRIAVVLAVLVPIVAQAAGLQAQDTVAGLQTEVRLTGFPSGSTVDVSVEAPYGDAFDQVVQIDARGEGLAVVSGSDTEQAGIYTVRASGSAVSTTFSVLPDRIDAVQSSISTSTTTLSPDGSDVAIVEVEMKDRFGNPLPDRPVTLIPSRTQDIAVPEGETTDAQGRQRFRVATTIPGTLTLRAMDLLSGIILNASVQINAGAPALGNGSPWSASLFQPAQNSPYTAQLTTGVIDRFELTVPLTMEIDKEASKITVRATDRNGNTVEGYTGTVRFTSTDPTAALPNFGTYVFKDRDLGLKEFPLVLKFRTPGKQRVRVEDAQDSRIFGEAEVTVTGKAAPQAGTITISSPKADQTLGGAEVLVEGNAPPLINIVVKGGAKTVTGDTDQSGRFSVAVPVSPTAQSATFTVEDDQGRYTSQPVTVRIDASEPMIDTVTFNPARPEAGMQTLVIVKSEPKLRSVTVTLTKVGGTQPQPLQLLENPNTPGSYQTFFTAPEPGTYQPMVQTSDTVGNNGKFLTNLTIDAKSLPIVQNLRGEAKSDSVVLEWNAVEATIDGYRLYVGENEGDYLYTLDTGIAQTKATVKGLLPGHRYVFAVTALRGTQESKDKSLPLALETIGIKLTVLPQDTALQLQWSGVPASLPLQSYILEYGIAEGSYSERRFLSGDAETYVLRDLINSVTYYLRLTPVTVTGDMREDLAVTAGGTPNGAAGYRPSAGDPIPGDLEPIIGEQHEGAPEDLTGSGFSFGLWMPATGITLLLVGGFLYRRNRMRQTEAFLRALAARTRA